jgi:hypothetical protein
MRNLAKIADGLLTPIRYHRILGPIWSKIQWWAELYWDESTSSFCLRQAVAMHIHRGRRHRTFLHNLVRLSSRYVPVMENWFRHDFVGDLQSIAPRLNLY